MVIQPHFIENLKYVYEPDCCKEDVSCQFLSELSKVYLIETEEDEKTDEEYSKDDLFKLGLQLEELRAAVQKINDDRISHLDRDDPWFCTISLYAPMDYGRLEVAHTRTLAWLLNPLKEHGFGSFLLQKLLPLFDNKSENVGPFEIKNIESERILLNDEIRGRTDIWIEAVRDNNPCLIVIEAKIDATEGEKQLPKYEYEINKTGIKDVVCVFLTPNGRKPQADGLKYYWSRVSFNKIAGCLAEASRDLKETPGYHFLRFYVAGIMHDILEWKAKGKANPYLLFTYLNQMEGEI